MAIIQNFSLSVLGCVFICHNCWARIKELLLSFHIIWGLPFLGASFSPGLCGPRGASGLLLHQEPQVDVFISPYSKAAFAPDLSSLSSPLFSSMSIIPLVKGWGKARFSKLEVIQVYKNPRARIIKSMVYNGSYSFLFFFYNGSYSCGKNK